MSNSRTTTQKLVQLCTNRYKLETSTTMDKPATTSWKQSIRDPYNLEAVEAICENAAIRRSRKTENMTHENLETYTTHLDLKLKLSHSFNRAIDISFIPLVYRPHFIIVFDHIPSIKFIFVKWNMITSFDTCRRGRLDQYVLLNKIKQPTRLN
ncbi:hypothetical protein YC2023_008731 [Brassica napus]